MIWSWDFDSFRLWFGTFRHSLLLLVSGLPAVSNNLHAKTQKLWKRSAMRVAAVRPCAVHWTANRIVDAPRVPAEMLTAVHSVRLHAGILACAGLMPAIDGGADMQCS